MELTAVEKEMIRLLGTFDITEDEGISVVVLLRDDVKRNKMISYLCATPNANSIEIVEKAVALREA